MRYFCLFLISTSLFAQSGVYDGLNVGLDEDSNTLTAVFDLSDYHANGTVERCQLFVIASKNVGEKHFTASIYNFDYQLLGYGNLTYSPDMYKYNFKLEKEVQQCNRIMKGFMGEGIDFYQKYTMDWVKIKLVKASRAYFYSKPGNGFKTKSYITHGEWVGVLESKNDWAKVDYITPNTKKFTRTWIRKQDLVAD
jgi:hypothetical protein